MVEHISVGKHTVEKLVNSPIPSQLTRDHNHGYSICNRTGLR
jgi:hypothetical protein